MSMPTSRAFAKLHRIVSQSGKNKLARNLKNEILTPQSKARKSLKTEMCTSSIDQMCSKGQLGAVAG
jgi:hypothetical protein